MIFGIPIFMIICVLVVIASWFGIEPDWYRTQIKAPTVPLRWALFAYVAIVSLGYIFMVGLVVKGITMML